MFNVALTKLYYKTLIRQPDWDNQKPFSSLKIHKKVNLLEFSTHMHQCLFLIQIVY